jgi:hypothetical protein
MVGVRQHRGSARLRSERDRVDQRPPRQAGLAAVHAGSGQQLAEEPPQLLTLLACHPEQLLLLEGRQRLVVLLDGGQGAKQGGQRSAQLVGDHGQQLISVVAGRLGWRDRLVWHRELPFPDARQPGAWLRPRRHSRHRRAAGSAPRGGLLANGLGGNTVHTRLGLGLDHRTLAGQDP